MKISHIKYPTPISAIKDIENDNIDVFVELEDGITCTVVVATPKNLLWYMEKEGKQYIEAGVPYIIVKELTEENIKSALESYAENDAYWLKLYHLAGESDDIFEISKMNSMIIKN